MKLVKKLTFAFVATLAVSTLTACSLYTGIPGRDGKEKVEEVTHKKPNELNIGVSISTTNNPYFVSMNNAIKSMAKEKNTKLIMPISQ